MTISTLSDRTWLVAHGVVALALAAQACVPRPPIEPLPTDGGPGDTETIDLAAFVKDEPILAGRWYTYDVDAGHLLLPHDRSYVLRVLAGADDVQYIGMRPVTYYDPDTANSGRFTLAFATHDGQTWSAERELLASANIKTDGPVCLNVLDEAEVPCAGDWHVQLRPFPFLVREQTAIVVTNPGIFVGAGTTMAHVEGAGTLGALPDPAALPVLSDADAPGWDTLEFDKAQYSPNLPRIGMALGDRWAGPGFTAKHDAYILQSGRRRVVKLGLAPTTEGAPADGLEITWQAGETNTDSTLHLPTWSAVETTHIPAPALGDTAFLSFAAAEDDLVLTSPTGSTVLNPPNERTWDIAVLHHADGLRLMLSPQTAVFNATHAAMGTADDLEAVTLPLYAGES